MAEKITVDIVHSSATFREINYNYFSIVSQVVVVKCNYVGCRELNSLVTNDFNKLEKVYDNGRFIFHF